MAVHTHTTRGYFPREQDGIHAAFMCNHLGDISATFPSVIHTKASCLRFCQQTGDVRIEIGGAEHYVTTVSQAMAKMMSERQSIRVRAMRSNGEMCEAIMPLEVL